MHTPAAIEEALAALPRHRLLHLPTPLQLCERLSRQLGGPRLWIKRDELSGLAFGGNKSRYLEFTLAQATAQGADAVVLSAVVQSNHCRQCAAACARLGLKAVLVLRESETPMGRSAPPTGNLLLDHLFGAEVRLAPPERIAAVVEEEMQRLRREGYSPFTGVSALLSRTAFVPCALEIASQCREEGIEPGNIFVGSGGNTLAGLVAGFALQGMEVGLTGMAQHAVGDPGQAAERVARMAGETVEHLGLSCAIDAQRIRVEDAYTGPGFGHLDERTRQAVLLLAKSEGLLVDPTYSGKAFAGLLDYVRQGRLHRDEDVVFVHTGGTPLLFTYGEALLSPA